jgi:hypothetical protein
MTRGPVQRQNDRDSHLPPADAAVDRVLVDVLRAAEDSGGCFDADTLAAWHERTLSRTAALQTEAHLSNCARCQELLATFVRTLPASEATRDTASAAIPAAPAFWRRWQLPWLMPLAAAASLGLWVAWPDETGPVAPSDVQARLEEPSPALRAEQSGPTAAPAPSATGGGARETARATGAGRRREAPPATLDKASPSTAGAGDVDRSRSLPAGKTPEPPATVLRESFRSEEAAVGAAPPNQATRRPDTAPAPTAAAPTAAAPQPPAAPATRGDAAGAERAEGQARAVERSVIDNVARGFAPTVVEIRSAAHAGRWRIREGRLIEYADGTDAPWAAAEMPAVSGLVAGQSPVPGVCWIVGRDGVILRTANGLRFTRVSSPSAMALTAVRAVDAQTATVTTEGGLAFHTQDGGMTWTPVAPLRP